MKNWNWDIIVGRTIVIGTYTIIAIVFVYSVSSCRQCEKKGGNYVRLGWKPWNTCVKIEKEIE